MPARSPRKKTINHQHHHHQQQPAWTAKTSASLCQHQNQIHVNIVHQVLNQSIFIKIFLFHPTVSQSSGVVNLAFDESPTDPDATTSKNLTTLQQAVVSSSTHSTTTPLIYFIHGAGESAESWRRVMNFFAARQYEVLALDLLGHGFSCTPQVARCYTFSKLLADVTAVFDAHVSEGRKVVIVGHGYGCSLAVALSRQRSANVALLALLGSGGPTPLAPPVTWRRHEWKLPRSLLRCLRSLLPCGIRRNVFYGPRGLLKSKFLNQ